MAWLCGRTRTHILHLLPPRPPIRFLICVHICVCRWSHSCPMSTPVRGCLKEFMPTFRIRWVSKLRSAGGWFTSLWCDLSNLLVHMCPPPPSRWVGHILLMWEEHRNTREMGAGTIRWIAQLLLLLLTFVYNGAVQCSHLWLKQLQLGL